MAKTPLRGAPTPASTANEEAIVVPGIAIESEPEEVELEEVASEMSNFGAELPTIWLWRMDLRAQQAQLAG